MNCTCGVLRGLHVKPSHVHMYSSSQNLCVRHDSTNRSEALQCKHTKTCCDEQLVKLMPSILFVWLARPHVELTHYIYLARRVPPVVEEQNKTLIVRFSGLEWKCNY